MCLWSLREQHSQAGQKVSSNTPNTAAFISFSSINSYTVFVLLYFNNVEVNYTNKSKTMVKQPYTNLFPMVLERLHKLEDGKIKPAPVKKDLKLPSLHHPLCLLSSCPTTALPHSIVQHTRRDAELYFMKELNSSNMRIHCSHLLLNTCPEMAPNHGFW